MAEAVYVLCAVTAVACAVLLFRGYRASRTKLLFWSSVCFFGLAINNVFLLLDLVVFPGVFALVDLALWRSTIALGAVSFLLYGLIWETK